MNRWGPQRATHCRRSCDEPLRTSEGSTQQKKLWWTAEDLRGQHTAEEAVMNRWGPETVAHCRRSCGVSRGPAQDVQVFMLATSTGLKLWHQEQPSNAEDNCIDTPSQSHYCGNSTDTPGQFLLWHSQSVPLFRHHIESPACHFHCFGSCVATRCHFHCLSSCIEIPCNFHCFGSCVETPSSSIVSTPLSLSLSPSLSLFYCFSSCIETPCNFHCFSSCIETPCNFHCFSSCIETPCNLYSRSSCIETPCNFHCLSSCIYTPCNHHCLSNSVEMPSPFHFSPLRLYPQRIPPYYKL